MRQLTNRKKKKLNEKEKKELRDGVASVTAAGDIDEHCRNACGFTSFAARA